MLIENQLAGAFEDRVAQQQPLFSITSNVQQQEQIIEHLPQTHHRVIQPQLISQVLPPQLVTQAPQQISLPPQRVIQQGPPPQIIQQQIPQPPQIIQQQVPAPQIIQQVPVQIVSQRAPQPIIIP